MAYICDNCSNKDFCKYVDAMKANKDMLDRFIETKMVNYDTEPFKITFSCKYGR